VDVPSVSGDEQSLADLVEDALAAVPHLTVLRDGNNVLARTELGRERRVLLAGHLDTVPIADNVPSRREGDLLYGCGTSDMKSGDAVLLHLAATLTDPAYDLTFVLYDNEEVEADKSGLKRLVETRRELLQADLSVLMEPTNGAVEAGCQGTMRVAGPCPAGAPQRPQLAGRERDPRRGAAAHPAGGVRPARGRASTAAPTARA
jgi:succinyl-diaminopimelate desuccinylase